MFTNTAIGIGLNCNSASSQNAEFAYNAALAVCTNFTVDAWVFLNAYPAPGSSVQYGIVGTRQNGADDTFDFCINRPSGQSMDFHGDIGNGSSWINNGIDMQPTNPPFFFPPLTNGVWYNVGYVVRQGICQIYFQGILVTNVPLAAGMPTFIKTGQSVQVGSCDLIGTYHNGIILDVEMCIRDRCWCGCDYKHLDNEWKFRVPEFLNRQRDGADKLAASGYEWDSDVHGRNHQSWQFICHGNTDQCWSGEHRQ